MGLTRTIALIIFLVVNFILAILLESNLRANYTIELVIIVIGILLSIALLLGMAVDAHWSWPFATILFSALLANAIFLYITSSAFVAFTGLILVNTLGLLISVLSIHEPEQYLMDSMPLETYEAAVHPDINYLTTKRRSAKKKKKKK